MSLRTSAYERLFQPSAHSSLKTEAAGRKPAFPALACRICKALLLSFVVSDALCFAHPATAQTPSIKLPLGVTAFEASEDECFYEKVVPIEITKINQYFRALDASAWRKRKADLAKQLGTLTNIGSAMGSSSDCKTLGLAVGDALAISVIFIGLDPEASAAIKRLSYGGGRGINEPARPEANSSQHPPAVADMPTTGIDQSKGGSAPSITDRGYDPTHGQHNQINRIH